MPVAACAPIVARRCLPGLGIAAVLATPGALAQEPPSGSDLEPAIEEIVVTGSRIRRRDFMSSSPLTTIDRETIAFSAQPSVEDTLNQMPQVTPDFGRTSNNPGDGTARINLRGFGAGRTLVMLNGRRIAPSDTGSAVDVNNLPQVLLERVEIITGGATTVYGSDAVAGVVNFITRDDFTGLNFEASANTTAEGDAEVYDANIAWGFDLAGGGNVTVYAGTLERKALLAGERDLTRVALDNDDAAGTLFESGSPIIPEGVIYIPEVDLGGAVPFVTFDAAGDPRQVGFPTDDLYNFAPSTYLQTPLERDYAGLMGSIALGDAYELYFESQFSNNKASRQLAPVPAVTFARVATQSPFLSPAAQQFFADNYEVVPGVSAVVVGRRLSEVGPRIIETGRDYWRTVLGIRGALGGSWEFDGWLTYTDADESELYINDASQSRLLQGLLVNPATGECVDPSGGCVPVDVFGPGQLTPEAASFIRVDGVENVTNRTQTLASAFVRGPLVDGWAGSIDAAFGLEWRSDDASFAADDALFTGDTLGFRGAAPIEGREDVVEAYGEVLVPLLQGAKLAEYAALELGARYSDYDNAGGIWTWKVGGEWQPVASIRFRAMRQRSARAPNNEELFTEQFSEPAADVIVGDEDPCSASADPIGSGNAQKCILQGLPEDQLGVFEATGVPLEIVSGGNPALEPESADTWTVGVVLTPGWLPAWIFTADYFDLEVEDSIGSIDPFRICFDPQNTGNRFCDNLRRDPASGNIIEIFSPESNRGFISTRGVDLQANYQAQLPGWLELGGQTATLSLDSTWTHVLEYRWQENPVTQVVECAGYFGTFCNLGVGGAAFYTFPENRITTNVNYVSGPLTVHLTSRWIDGTENALALDADYFGEPQPRLAIPSIGSKHYLDLGVGWQITDDVTGRLGVDNLTDTDPPNMADAAQQNNTDAQLYDVFGRTYYLNVVASFFR